jgi:hypothetical protein
MRRVIEGEIGPQRLRVHPFHTPLGNAVMAGHALRRIGPQRAAGLIGAGVAARAGGKETPMLRMIEAFGLLRCDSLPHEETEEQDSGRATVSPHGAPFPEGMRRIAGGSDWSSAPLPRRSLTLAVARN